MEYKKGSHTVYDIEYHVVWTTKYRYKILRGKIAERLRELLRQGYQAHGMTIVRGNVGRDHVHIVIIMSSDVVAKQDRAIAEGPKFEDDARGV